MKVFVDASVILAALGSKTGGSSLVLELGRRRGLDLVTSQGVIEEVRRNCPKIGVSWTTAEPIITRNRISVIGVPSVREVEKYGKTVGEKDAHVIASAVSSNSKIVITLDRKHLLHKDVKQKLKSIKLLTPGELLQLLT